MTSDANKGEVFCSIVPYAIFYSDKIKLIGSPKKVCFLLCCLPNEHTPRAKIKGPDRGSQNRPISSRTAVNYPLDACHAHSTSSGCDNTKPTAERSSVLYEHNVYKSTHRIYDKSKALGGKKCVCQTK